MWIDERTRSTAAAVQRSHSSSNATHLVAGSLALAIAAFHPFASSCSSTYSPVEGMATGDPFILGDAMVVCSSSSEEDALNVDVVVDSEPYCRFC